MFQEMLQIFAAKFQYYNPAFMLKEFSSINDYLSTGGALKETLS
jgi:hypothetical protein